MKWPFRALHICHHHASFIPIYSCTVRMEYAATVITTMQLVHNSRPSHGAGARAGFAPSSKLLMANSVFWFINLGIILVFLAHGIHFICFSGGNAVPTDYGHMELVRSRPRPEFLFGYINQITNNPTFSYQGTSY